MGCIYMWTNNKNKKKYLGQCRVDIMTRYYAHVSGHGGSQLLKNAIDKYGIKNFTFEILHDGVLDEFLDDYEKEAIREYNSIVPNGYNIESGGNANKSISDSTRQKISKSLKKYFSDNPDVREAMSERRKGIKQTEEANHKKSETMKNYWSLPDRRREQSERFKGRKHSDESRRKMSEATKGEKNHRYGKKHSEETRRKMSETHKGEKNYFYGKTHSTEVRRRMSENGKNNPLFIEARRKATKAAAEYNKGRKYPVEHRENISKALTGRKLSLESRRKMSASKKGKPSPKRSPLREPARNLFDSLPNSLSLEEKRKILQEKYLGLVDRTTINKWIVEWQPNESASKKRKRQKNRERGYELFRSLPRNLSIEEKRKFLREKMPHVNRRTIYKWVEKWQSELEATQQP